LTGAADRTAKLWDVSTILIADGNNSTAAKELLTLRGHTRGLTSASFSPDGQTALTTSRDGLSILWAADSWKPRSP
jgi:WD40 repeat protein